MNNLGFKSVVHYSDDFLIHTLGVEEYTNIVEEVLRAHWDAGIRLTPAKTLFFSGKGCFFRILSISGWYQSN